MTPRIATLALNRRSCKVTLAFSRGNLQMRNDGTPHEVLIEQMIERKRNEYFAKVNSLPSCLWAILRRRHEL